MQTLQRQFHTSTPAPVVMGGIGKSPQRILVYCHDLYGLGNVRRMLLFCHHLRAAYPEASLLFLMGGSNIGLFTKPSNFDVVKLPEIARDASGVLGPRGLSDGLEPVLAMRKSLISACAAAFDPDLFIVDKKPLGALGELKPTLEILPRTCPRVLVTRDILDTPEMTIAEMRSSDFEAAIEAHYDQIQVLGEESVFDFAAAYQLSAKCSAKVHFTGFLTPTDNPCPPAKTLRDLELDPGKKTVFVTVGGGEDGLGTLLSALDFAEAEPASAQVILLAGPKMDEAAFALVNARAERLPHVRLLRQSNSVQSLIAASDVTVSMAGYNSVCGIMATGKPAILLPRVEPSKEQLVRAEMLASRGLAQMVLPDAGPVGLANAIRRALSSDIERQAGFDFDVAGTTRRIASGFSQIGVGGRLN